MKVKAGVVWHAVMSQEGEKAPITLLMEHKGFATRVSYKLAKLGRKLGEEAELLRGRVSALQDKHRVTERGVDVDSLSEEEKAEREKNVRAFNVEVGDLMEMEIEIVAEPVELPPEAEISPEVLMPLVDFVTVKE